MSCYFSNLYNLEQGKYQLVNLSSQPHVQYIVQSQKVTLSDSRLNKFIAYITSSKEYYSEAIGTEHS